MNNDIWIKQVEIVNFQSHQHTTLPLVKGTNALVGSSNSGKSAVIRAIRWCLINTPNGTEFIRVGEKEAMVKVTLSNGKTIERRRNRGNVNLYRLYEGDDLVSEFTGFGSKIPPEIIEAHGITPIAGDIYFQFAHQLEAPFMLSLKPKQRAEVLGNLDELARIDKALVETNDDIRVSSKVKKEKEKSEKGLMLQFEKMKLEAERFAVKVDTLKSLKEGIESKIQMRTVLEQQLTRLKEIDVQVQEVRADIAKADRILQHWPEDLEERISQFKLLKRYMNRLKEIKMELESISYLKEDKLQQLEHLRDTIEEKVRQHRTLSHLMTNLKENERTLQEARNSYSERIAMIDYHQLDMDISKYRTLFQQLERLRKIDQEMEANDLLIKEATQNIDRLIDQFVEALQTAKICPTCGQETHSVCNEVVESVI